MICWRWLRSSVTVLIDSERKDASVDSVRLAEGLVAPETALFLSGYERTVICWSGCGIAIIRGD